MDVRITEKLATKTAMDVKAARSRMKSVICLSLLVMFQLCSHFVSMSTAFFGLFYCQRAQTRPGSAGRIIGKTKPRLKGQTGFLSLISLCG